MPRTRCLLDNVPARYAVQGLLKLAEGRDLTRGELFSLDLVSRAQTRPARLFIALPTANVLYRLVRLSRYADIVRFFLGRVEVVYPARYFARWARRLRGYGFTREDAAILALASFGTDKDAAILGLHVVATLDAPMINNWVIQRHVIQKRLVAMQADIPEPYRYTFLPQVLRPEQVTFVLRDDWL